MDLLLNKKLFWLYITSMWLSIRLVVFTQYKLVVTVVWWIMAFFIAFAVHALWSGGEIIILAVAFFLQNRFYRFMQPAKAKLIRMGDSVEFAEEVEGSYMQTFKSAKVLRKMRCEDVAATGLFSEELIPFYSHFYLVEMKDKNGIIPYEWFLSIDFEDEIDA
jgi:ASC-1-like (ASCH) protein